MELATTKYGDRTFENIFQQEMTQYKDLLHSIHNTISEVMRTINGSTIADQHFDRTFSEIVSNKVPSIWQKRNYITSKSLSNYIDDLHQRIPYFQKWAKSGTPPAIWLSAFYSPLAFMSVAKQNFAKRKEIDFDDVSIRAEVTTYEPNQIDELSTILKVEISLDEKQFSFAIKNTF